MKFIQDTLEVLSQMSYSRQSIRLEIAIVALIAVDIVLIIWELLKRSALGLGH